MLNLHSNREMLITAIMRHHHRAPGWLTWSRLTISSANKEMQHCWWERELEQPLWKTARESLLKRNICMLHGTAIPLLNIYSTVMCARGHRRTATRMFVITKKWKEFKYPLAAELIIHCSTVSHMMKICTSMEMNRPQLPTRKWMTLAAMMLNKRSQAQKNTFCAILCT